MPACRPASSARQAATSLRGRWTSFCRRRRWSMSSASTSDVKALGGVPLNSGRARRVLWFSRQGNRFRSIIDLGAAPHPPDAIALVLSPACLYIAIVDVPEALSNE
ncbi:hypothetical protein MESS2_350016 [Mesorhizobium metallidurans STM 2683]|uniref:Uncharacterized protein n=1 Tax=Mesorhizobium metallidurans STM 2683 TaxID=1297569 RepID=M5EPF5_9HYPH|nr:hypothetical protein MESS2_350016 [Mesorhizobium metallidurans STM 2683]